MDGCVTKKSEGDEQFLLINKSMVRQRRRVFLFPAQ